MDGACKSQDREELGHRRAASRVWSPCAWHTGTGPPIPDVSAWGARRRGATSQQRTRTRLCGSFVLGRVCLLAEAPTESSPRRSP